MTEYYSILWTNPILFVVEVFEEEEMDLAEEELAQVT